MGGALEKKLRRGWGEFSTHNRPMVSDDSKIKFWHDIWCRDQALEIAYPNLYRI